LVEREAAIVTALAGTTRDVIEAPLRLAGYRVLLADMAGIRPTEDPIEAEGVRRARAWAESADLRLWVVDQSAADEAWREGMDLVRPGDLCVLNKADLSAGRAGRAAALAAEAHGLEVRSSDLAAGLTSDVVHWLKHRVATDLGGADFPATTRLRHTAQLSSARSHLLRAVTTLGDPELAAEDVRLASRALGQVTGDIGVEDILDGVFSTFCIGK
jgi:tRNA modification GTPase